MQSNFIIMLSAKICHVELNIFIGPNCVPDIQQIRFKKIYKILF